MEAREEVATLSPVVGIVNLALCPAAGPEGWPHSKQPTKLYPTSGFGNHARSSSGSQACSPGLRSRVGGPLAQLRQSGKDRKKVTACSRDKKAQSPGLGIHSQCSLSFKLSPAFSVGYLGYHHSNPLWLIILQVSPASFQFLSGPGIHYNCCVLDFSTI